MDPVQQEIMSHALLSAPHILYAVFLHLPQQDLLIIQRVCRVWRKVIASSNVLQAALFLQPPVSAGAGEPLNEPVRMNPLLLSRFPAFFDIEPNHTNRHPTSHSMGPYYTTHWAESIRPWVQFIRRGKQHDAAANEDSVRSVPDSLVGLPEQLDPDRTAAYRHPEASWRRMLTCVPPPAELQVRYQSSSALRGAGTIHRLCFDIANNGQTSSAEDNSRREEREPRWLTFGLLYDIFEAAWFRSQPSGICAWQFDWTFQDIRPRMQDFAARGLVSPTVEEIKNSYRYGEREALRNCLRDTPIGGTGRVLILTRDCPKAYQGSAYCNKRFRAAFELQRLDGNAIKWDEVIPYNLE